MSLFATLQAALPTKREVHPDGWPESVWVHRLSLPDLIALGSIQPVDEEADNTPWLMELLARCVGDTDGPGEFATAEAKAWLAVQSKALTELANAALQINELTGSAIDRKKG